MEKRIINPWTWQDARNYAQAVEVKNVQSTLYISGQTAIDDNGISSTDDMRTQILKALENLKKVILQADFKAKNIVRLSVYTTNHEEFFNNFDVLQHWIIKHEVQQATTVMEVKTLFETLKVEFEATVVK
jgi:2-iminobutanoate/2-iminopropanoate deaminase